MPRIAVAQTPGVRLEQWRETLTLVLDLIRTAAEHRADVVVLPECVWPTYLLGSRQALAAARASGMPTEVKLLEELTHAARSHGLAICAGYVSEQADRLLNRACFINRHGELLGTHDKCFLWDFDRRWFTPGRSIRPIDTEFGPVGIMICADARLPEIPATLAARGAKLILQPTAWVNAGSLGRLWNPQADFLIAARAAEFGLPIASASKWGREGDTTFVGSSLICDAGGRILVQAPQAETCVLTADVEPGSNPHVRITGSEREALLSADPPVRPRAAGRASLSLTRSGILLIWHMSQETAAPTDRPPADDTVAQRAAATPVSKLQLRGPVSGVIHSGPAVIGSVSDEAASRFAPCRVLALRGAHAVIVWGDRVSEPALRSRAAENRIFVAHVCSDRLKVYAPSGLPAAATGPEEPIEIDLGAAIDKQVAWQTDVLAGRAPHEYDF